MKHNAYINQRLRINVVAIKLYLSLFNNDVRIANNVLFKNKKLYQNNFNNDIAFIKTKLLTFVTS